jgi:hypothetical protein
MKAEERTIGNILTEQIQYEIPAYQRPYSWGKENVQQLLEDVWEAFAKDEPEYFIGSLITIEKTRDQRYEVVDGQQRLTTLNLVLAGLRDRISSDAVKAELQKRLLPQNVFTGEAETPRLTLRQKDNLFFRSHVLEGKPLPAEGVNRLDAPQRHLAENLQAILEFCDSREEHALRLFANYMLQNVWVVFVRTDSWQSAYRLFNVLNARGMPLSNADLVKNLLFSELGADSKRGDELEQRWMQLEDTVGIDRLDLFFGYHRTSVVAAKARETLYAEITKLVREDDGGPFGFLEDVVHSAGNYIRIREKDFTHPATLRALGALHRVEYDEWIPPLLAYLNQPLAELPESEFVSLLERVTMQNWVRRLGRTARLTVYYQLISAIRAGRTADEVRQIVRSAADNAEFLDLLDGTVYGQPFDSAVLMRLDEASQDDSVTRVYDGRITIEHVMPQAFKDPYWVNRFSAEEHATWLHRLGNLALLAGSKNYKAQYYDFERKKAIYNERNKTVSFDLTKEVVQEPEWSPETIARRQSRMMELAREIWTIH